MMERNVIYRYTPCKQSGACAANENQLFWPKLSCKLLIDKSLKESVAGSIRIKPHFSTTFRATFGYSDLYRVNIISVILVLKAQHFFQKLSITVSTVCFTELKNFSWGKVSIHLLSIPFFILSRVMSHPSYRGAKAGYNSKRSPLHRNVNIKKLYFSTFKIVGAPSSYCQKVVKLPATFSLVCY